MGGGHQKLKNMTIQSRHEAAQMRGAGSGVEDPGGVWGEAPRFL
jgi:hypothetical protein